MTRLRFTLAQFVDVKDLVPFTTAHKSNPIPVTAEDSRPLLALSRTCDRRKFGRRAAALVLIDAFSAASASAIAHR
jgi:hypothetical protein